MENPTTKLSTIALRYGLIGGLLSVIFSMVMYFAGLQEERWPQFISYFILFIVLFLAAKYYRDIVLGGPMTFSKGFQVAALTTVFIMMINLVWMYAYLEFIDPELVGNIMDKNMMKMEESGMSDAEIEQAMNISSKFMTPISMSFFAALFGIVIGLVFSLIVGAITQKK